MGWFKSQFKCYFLNQDELKADNDCYSPSNYALAVHESLKEDEKFHMDNATGLQAQNTTETIDIRPVGFDALGQNPNYACDYGTDRGVEYGPTFTVRTPSNASSFFHATTPY